MLMFDEWMNEYILELNIISLVSNPSSPNLTSGKFNIKTLKISNFYISLVDYMWGFKFQIDSSWLLFQTTSSIKLVKILTCAKIN